jgi:hypothetical protein
MLAVLMGCLLDIACTCFGDVLFFLLLASLWPTIVLLLTVSVLCSAIAPWIAFGMCPVVLFGLCIACSVRAMPAYKFGPSGFVRRLIVLLRFHRSM